MAERQTFGTKGRVLFLRKYLEEHTDDDHYITTEELIRLLDEYFMLHMGKTWVQIVTDFESRPTLVVLRDIYEVLKPWVWCHGEEERRAYRENYECLMEKITNRYSREVVT